jgi:hypothetical protein
LLVAVVRNGNVFSPLFRIIQKFYCHLWRIHWNVLYRSIDILTFNTFRVLLFEQVWKIMKRINYLIVYVIPTDYVAVKRGLCLVGASLAVTLCFTAGYP